METEVLMVVNMLIGYLKCNMILPIGCLKGMTSQPAHHTGGRDAEGQAGILTSLTWLCLAARLCHQCVNFALLVPYVLCHLPRCDSLVKLTSCPKETERSRSFCLEEGIPNVKIVFKPLYVKEILVTFLIEDFLRQSFSRISHGLV